MTDDIRPRFDERGARLLRTRVFFTSKPLFSREELEEKKLLTRQDLDGTWWSDFYLVPAEMYAGATYVAVALHSHPPHDHQHWEFAYAFAPTGTPPSFITRATYDRIDNIRELIARAFPTDGPSNIRARLYYELDPVRFPKALDRFGTQFLIERGDGISLRPKSLEWDVRGAKHVTSLAISLADEDEDEEEDDEEAADGSPLRVVVRADVDVKISETTHRDVDGQVWQELTSCLG